MKFVIDMPREYYDSFQKDIPVASGVDGERIMFNILKSAKPISQGEGKHKEQNDPIFKECPVCGKAFAYTKVCPVCNAELRGEGYV